MSDKGGVKLGLRRLKNVTLREPLTVGKVYISKGVDVKGGHVITSDTGRPWTTHNPPAPDLWQAVWVLPDGTELEALP